MLAPSEQFISVLAPYRHPKLYTYPIRALQLKAHALPASRALHLHHPGTPSRYLHLTDIPSFTLAPSGHSSSRFMPYGHPEPQARTIRVSLALDLHYPGTPASCSRLTGIPSFTFSLTRHPSSVLAPYGHPELRACPNRAL